MAKVDISELRKFQAKLKEVATEKERKAFYEACLKELAARFLQKVEDKTPTGDNKFEVVRAVDGSVVKYKRGKRKGKVKLKRIAGGGALKRAWRKLRTKKKHVRKIGNTYQIELINNTPYASYVEYGHSQNPGQFVPVLEKRLKASWVKGQFPMTNSAKEIEDIAPVLLQQKIEKYLEEKLNGK